MNKAVIAVLVALAVVILGGLIIYQQNTSTGTNEKETAPSSGESVIAPAGNVVEITSSGFSPQELTIKKGETVRWINKQSRPSWPASAQHPTHTVYPGSSILKCETSEKSSIFDSCKGLIEGGSWSFTFNEVGSWGYHNHLASDNFGKIIVK